MYMYKHVYEVLVTTDYSSVFALSFLTVSSGLCQGYPAPYKTVLARAATRSTILRLPASAFESVFKKYPETLVRVIQVTDCLSVNIQYVVFHCLEHLIMKENVIIFYLIWV